MQQRPPAFLARHGSSDAARAVAAAEEQEIALHERCRAFAGHGYYVARKTERPFRCGRRGPLPLPLPAAEMTAVRSLRAEIIESKPWRRPDRSQLEQREPALVRP